MKRFSTLLVFNFKPTAGLFPKGVALLPEAGVFNSHFLLKFPLFAGKRFLVKQYCSG